jgi:uncharacterized repeat protein (TIGR01451 family)
MICRLSHSLNARRKASAVTLALVAIVLFGAAAPAAAATPESADLATTVLPGLFSRGNITYGITVANHGPSYAQTVLMSDNWWGGMMVTFVSVRGSSPSGVSCTASPAGSPGTVTCTTASLAPGASMAVALMVHVGFLFHHQLLGDNARASSQTFDPNTANNTATTVAEGP